MHIWTHRVAQGAEVWVPQPIAPRKRVPLLVVEAATVCRTMGQICRALVGVCEAIGTLLAAH